jgi:hypothetical protein
MLHVCDFEQDFREFQGILHKVLGVMLLFSSENYLFVGGLLNDTAANEINSWRS